MKRINQTPEGDIMNRETLIAILIFLSLFIPTILTIAGF
jgi:hypothetical protein